MTTVKIRLDSIEKIKEFNGVLNRFSCDFDLEQGRYYIDAKSMLGIMSLDLNSPLQLHFSAAEEEKNSVMEAIKGYVEE